MNDEHLNRTIYLYDDGIGRVSLIQHMGTDATVIRSARVSYGKDKDNDLLEEKDKKLLKYLIDHQHTSVLEHCSLTCKFVVPLFIAVQHFRHRTWAFNSSSRRYSGENIQFYQPSQYRTQHKNNKQGSNWNETVSNTIMYEDKLLSIETAIKHFHTHAFELYQDLLNAGVCREQARGVLPQNMYNEYYGTVNLNNLIKFLNLRLSHDAQLEIVLVARALLSIAEELWPITIGYVKEKYGWQDIKE